MSPFFYSYAVLVVMYYSLKTLPFLLTDLFVFSNDTQYIYLHFVSLNHCLIYREWEKSGIM